MIKKTEKNIRCKCVATGEFADVWLFDDALFEYEQLGKLHEVDSVRQYRTICRYFERFVQFGPTSLSDKMFKYLGSRKADGGIKVKVSEFKAYQFRIYGVIGERGRKRTFFGMTCDPKKKKNKADPKHIQRAADLYQEYKN